MTRLTKSNLYFYFKLLQLETNNILELIHWEDRYYLKMLTERGDTKLTRNLSFTEMYEVIYSMCNLMQLKNAGTDGYSPLKKLSKKQQEYLRNNLHNNDIIEVKYQ